MALTDRQRKFVDAYLLEPNGKKAAIAAGYSPATAVVQASRLLRHEQIRVELARRQAPPPSPAAPAPMVTLAAVIAELTKIGLAKITDVVKWRSNCTELGID